MVIECLLNVIHCASYSAEVSLGTYIDREGLSLVAAVVTSGREKASQW